MRRSVEEQWSSFGKHEHRFEPPDLYFCRVHGDVSGAEMQTQIDAIRELAARRGHGIFWLSDIREMGILTPEARRAAAVASSGEMNALLRGSAVFGGSFTRRVMVTLLARAVRLLRPNQSRPLAFVETEADARAYLTQNGQGQAPTAATK